MCSGFSSGAESNYAGRIGESRVLDTLRCPQQGLIVSLPWGGHPLCTWPVEKGHFWSEKKTIFWHFSRNGLELKLELGIVGIVIKSGPAHVGSNLGSNGGGHCFHELSSLCWFSK